MPLDGVLVTSPHAEHYQHARAALEHGCHVLVEKPLATSAADARRLVALARAREREILIPHGWNFRPYTREARRLVRAGAIGPLEHVVCQMASPLRDLFSGEPLRETEGALFRPPPAPGPTRGGPGATAGASSATPSASSSASWTTPPGRSSPGWGTRPPGWTSTTP